MHAGSLPLIVCLVMLMTATAAAQDAPAKKKPEPPMRKATQQELSLLDGKKEKIDYPESPIINEEGLISIIPGEKLAVRFEKDGDKLVKPVLEKDTAKQKDCVLLDCSHTDGHLMLVVKNPYDKFLHYKCGTIQHGSEDGAIERRRNLPVNPGLKCYEGYNGTEVILFFKDFFLHDTYEGPAGPKPSAPPSTESGKPMQP